MQNLISLKEFYSKFILNKWKIEYIFVFNYTLSFSLFFSAYHFYYFHKICIGEIITSADEPVAAAHYMIRSTVYVY